MSTIEDNRITQMVSKPTRGNNILDLFLTKSPTLVGSVSNIPSIFDHSTMIAVVRLRSAIQKVKSRTVHLYCKVDWESITVYSEIFVRFFFFLRNFACAKFRENQTSRNGKITLSLLIKVNLALVASFSHH